jgi:hypothetical protein
MPLTEPSATAHAPVHDLIKKTNAPNELGIKGNFPVDKAVLKGASLLNYSFKR